MKRFIFALYFCVTVLLLSVSVLATDTVIYVSDNGNDQNIGTAAAPVKTLAAAYDYVSKGGTVVVCGPLTLSGDALQFPSSTGKVTVTSAYGGVNYKETNGAVLNLTDYTYLNGETEFNNILIHDASSKWYNQLVCQGHSLWIGDGVSCTRATGEAITIIGGKYINSNALTAEDVSFYDYSITVNSGVWYMINGGNKRTANESAMGATGNVRVTINGGTFTGQKAYNSDAMISVGGYASQDGDYYLEINGGVFNTPIVAIARPGNNSGRYTAYYDGDVFVKITGGEFKKTDAITTVQSEAASYIGGNYTLEITGGTFTELVTVSAPRVRGNSAAEVIPSLAAITTGFDVIGDVSENYITHAMPSVAAKDGVVFVGGRVDGDGKNAKTPFSSLEKAANALGEDGGTIVVCAPLAVKNATLKNPGGRLTVTSVYEGKDFREIADAEIRLSGILTLGGETVFENVQFRSNSLAAYIFCAGNIATFGKGIECTLHMDGGVTEHIGIFTGDRLVTSSDSALGKTQTNITIESGDWRFLRAGNERAHGGENTLRTVVGDSVIHISGGTFHEDVCGTGKNNHEGSITLNISGGTFLCSVYGMHKPANVDNDKSVVNGDITLRISGGDFHGSIAAVESREKNMLNGKYTLHITGGDFRGVGDITGTAGVLGINASELLATVDLSAAPIGEMTFTNPIIGSGADPSVYYHDGWYYYARPTTVGSTPAIMISRAANIADIGNTAAKTVYLSDGSIGSIWAPQAYWFDGSWYIYFSGAATTATSEARKPYILRSDSDDPLGTYTLIGVLGNLDPLIHSWLSPRIFTYEGERYYISSVFVSAEDNTSQRHKQTLVIGRMASPISLDGVVYAIAAPDKSWEGYDIIEGPFPVYGEDGTLYIAYAANYADGEDYCTGLLKLIGEDLLQPASWEKQPRPMQQRDSENLIFAPGAAVFVSAGEDVYAVYHVKLHANNRYNRSIFVQKLGYENGVPYLGAPPAIETVHTMQVNPMPVSERISGFGESGSFAKTRSYAEQFTDVTEEQWFYEYVKTAYEYALANGTSVTKFSPDSSFTVAQALTAAANIHTAYTGKSVRAATAAEKWYEPYVEYCIANGIITAEQFANYDANIQRGDMASVFAGILPDSEYLPVRTAVIPDVTMDMHCYAAVQKLYNAGIVGGDAGTGNYRPLDEIKRSEACVIFTRIAVASYRAQ